MCTHGLIDALSRSDGAGSYDNNDETESIFYVSITESGIGHVLALMDVECWKVGWGEDEEAKYRTGFWS